MLSSCDCRPQSKRLSTFHSPSMEGGAGSLSLSAGAPMARTINIIGLGMSDPERSLFGLHPLEYVERHLVVLWRLEIGRPRFSAVLGHADRQHVPVDLVYGQR